MAEGILKHKAKNLGIKLVVDSAGTSDNHEGEGPHFRAIAEMQLHGIDISHQRSRPFSVNDLICSTTFWLWTNRTEMMY
jgi:protein-tyrosine phosphatase